MSNEGNVSSGYDHVFWAMAVGLTLAFWLACWNDWIRVSHTFRMGTTAVLAVVVIGWMATAVRTWMGSSQDKN